ncbi:MAG: ABC1 kinase family protein [Euzebya sp.]
MTRPRQGYLSLPAKVARVARLASLPAASLYYAGVGGLRRLRGEDPAAVQADLRGRSAARTKRILGRAKGGALKAGQLLSTVDALFPADPERVWQRALATLPADNPPEPFEDLEPVLIQELGPQWRDCFDSFDTTAVAAASIGQVHRALWHDGRDVAVKIQYPGVAETLRLDIGVVSVATRLSAMVAPGMALPPLVAEMRDRLAEELDYLREARVQRAFAAAYREDSSVVVPDVVHATRRVLVTEWLPGTPFTSLVDAPQPVRDQAGLAYMRFLISGPERAGWLHTDPHPGNFRVTVDGRLGVLDFGSALPLPQGMPGTFGRLITLLRLQDPRAIRDGLMAEGFVRAGSTVDAVRLRDYLSPFTEPSQHQIFAFTPEWLKGQFGRLGDPRNPDFAVALQLTMPPEHLFTHRVWLGIVGVLCQLRCTIPVRDEVRRWLPGLD